MTIEQLEKIAKENNLEVIGFQHSIKENGDIVIAVLREDKVTTEEDVASLFGCHAFCTTEGTDLNTYPAREVLENWGYDVDEDYVLIFDPEHGAKVEAEIAEFYDTIEGEVSGYSLKALDSLHEMDGYSSKGYSAKVLEKPHGAGYIGLVSDHSEDYAIDTAYQLGGDGQVAGLLAKAGDDTGISLGNVRVYEVPGAYIVEDYGDNPHEPFDTPGRYLKLAADGIQSPMEALLDFADSDKGVDLIGNSAAQDKLAAWKEATEEEYRDQEWLLASDIFWVDCDGGDWFLNDILGDALRAIGIEVEDPIRKYGLPIKARRQLAEFLEAMDREWEEKGES